MALVKTLNPAGALVAINDNPPDSFQAIEDIVDEVAEVSGSLSDAAAIFVIENPDGTVYAPQGTLAINTTDGSWYTSDGVEPLSNWTNVPKTNPVGDGDTVSATSPFVARGLKGVNINDNIVIDTGNGGATGGTIPITANGLVSIKSKNDGVMVGGGADGGTPKVGFLDTAPIIKQPISAVEAATGIGAALIAFGLCYDSEA